MCIECKLQPDYNNPPTRLPLGFIFDKIKILDLLYPYMRCTIFVTNHERRLSFFSVSGYQYQVFSALSICRINNLGYDNAIEKAPQNAVSCLQRLSVWRGANISLLNLTIRSPSFANFYWCQVEFPTQSTRHPYWEQTRTIRFITEYWVNLLRLSLSAYADLAGVLLLWIMCSQTSSSSSSSS